MLTDRQTHSHTYIDMYMHADRRRSGARGQARGQTPLLLPHDTSIPSPHPQHLQHLQHPHPAWWCRERRRGGR
jgi:hypothetical protein